MREGKTGVIANTAIHFQWDKMKDKVSVIVPIFNVKKYLGKCINSICEQTYSNLEIILVDDGSTDGSGELCDFYKKTDSRIVVAHQNNKGLVNARKAGILLATGELATYVDADDWIEKKHIENMVKCLKENQVELVCANHTVENENFSNVGKNNISEGVYERDDIIDRSMYYGSFYKFGITQYVWSKLYITSYLKKIQLIIPDDISLGEDVALTYNYLLETKKIAVVKYSGYHYCQRIESMSKNKNPKFDNLILFLKNTLLKGDNYEIFANQLNQYMKLIQLTDKMFEQSGPFDDITNAKRVIVYGAGAMGKKVVQELKNKKVNIVAWLDKAYNITFFGQDIILNPMEFNWSDCTFDLIIIAITDEYISDEIVKDLQGNGIPQHKIKKITRTYINKWVLD